MDFVTNLPDSNQMNGILVVICRLSKERIYVPVRGTKEGTSAQELAKIFIKEVYAHYGLPDSIVSDRGTQFILVFWRVLCQYLGIDCKLSTVYYPETNGQTERANQDLTIYLRMFCNYWQDDWVKYLFLAMFTHNTLDSAFIGLSPFFLNYGYHPRMSFSPNLKDYGKIRDRILAKQAKDISDYIQKALDIAKANIQNTQNRTAKRINQLRKDITYKVGDIVWLSSKNIQTERFSRKLDDKQKGPFKILAKKGHLYQLALPESMRQYGVFYIKLLRKDPEDPLFGQTNPPLDPVIIKGKEEWFVKEILAARRRYNRL